MYGGVAGGARQGKAWDCVKIALVVGVVLIAWQTAPARAWDCPVKKDGESIGTIVSDLEWIPEENIYAFYSPGPEGKLYVILPRGTEVPRLNCKCGGGRLCCEKLPGILHVDNLEPWKVKFSSLTGRTLTVSFPLAAKESSLPADLIAQMTVGGQMTLIIPVAVAAEKIIMTRFDLPLKGFAVALKKCKNTTTDTAKEHS